jgi:mono/diheme cytochrome c family protein
MKRVLQVLVALAIVGFGAFWFLTTPIPPVQIAAVAKPPDLKNGELLFHAGGCISCHAAAGEAGSPSGGKPLVTPIGTLYPPNLTPDADTGLGNWQFHEFVAAMREGKDRDGSNLIPAFPYTSYRNMNLEDLSDLFAYLKSLPAVKNEVPENQVIALALVRRGLTLWKAAALGGETWKPDPAQSAGWNRGSYLVNGPGHCQECHTPRTLIMAADSSRMFLGGAHPEGTGKVPSIRGLVERGRYKDAADLVLAFQNGELLGYDKMASGGMGAVQTNLSKLPEPDLQAISEYLLSLK